VGELGSGVFAVVVDQDYGEFAGVILLEEAGYCLGDGGGFVAGRDYGDYAAPAAWSLVACRVVIEFAETPEFASGECQVEPDGEGDGADCKLGERHGIFWRSMLRGYKGNGGAFGLGQVFGLDW
jgi:hypothetical protein